MICPKCGNTITMQEYKCGVCGLDLNCSTPEGRQKAEAYANQMYASGRWKPRQPVHRITDIPAKKPEPIERITEPIPEKPKRTKSFAAAVVLGITTIIASFCFIVMVSICVDLQNENERLAAERDSLQEAQGATKNISPGQSEAEAKYQMYKYGVDRDRIGALNVANIIETLAGEDLQDVNDQIDDIFNSQYALLDKIHNSTEGEDMINALNEADALWQVTIGKLYGIASDSVGNARKNLDDMIDVAVSEDEVPVPVETPPTQELPRRTLVYEDSDFSIYFIRISDKGVELEVENRKSENIIVQANSIAINGYSAGDITMSDNVAASSTGKVVAKCDDFRGQTANRITGSLRIYWGQHMFDNHKIVEFSDKQVN